MAAPNILILLHERDRSALDIGYWIWTMREVWEEMGLRVDVVRGSRRAGPADLLFPHIDLTVTPPEYVALFDRYPLVVNRSTIDHSKRAISSNLVRPGDRWAEPVIVKTDRNSGGLRDRQLLGTFPQLASTRLRMLLGLRTPEIAGDGPIDFASVQCIPPWRYPIYDSIDAVPVEAFRNPALVVERFLPERSGETYSLRSYVFLGNRFHFERLGSSQPIVKAHTAVGDEEIGVDERVVPVRRRLRLDYGKLDYVVRNDGITVLDANTTPGYGTAAKDDVLVQRARRLAHGIREWLRIPP